ncbi:quinone-dependent dihydroorotate dehydrogenase [Candidatus Woesearchaeota archaeon]|nr:quinone-dependent dihydroorotate dehydrogenase [Candidatus Woesearchaeota archaeon]
MIELAYKKLLKPIFFKMDPEKVHDRMTRTGILLGKTSIGRAIMHGMFYYSHPSLKNTVAGITFDNPIGLAAGFDKNAQLYNILPEIGFGFAELGSITGEPCLGNPKPRLFRLPQEKSILVNYGLYNQGAQKIAHKHAHTKFKIPIGFSVAKTNDPSLSVEQGVQDYRKAYLHMHPLGAYTTINVSCPNTSDGITYQNPQKLALLLDALAKEKHLKPVFLKIKSDFTNAELAEIVDIAEKHPWVTGFIISNLRTNREGLKTSKTQIDQLSTKGALSGLPLQDQSNRAISFVSKRTNKIIIGCGGIFTGKDAYEKIKSGASLLQLITALIYEGPTVISKINRELVDLMQRDGYGRISEVIADARD